MMNTEHRFTQLIAGLTVLVLCGCNSSDSEDEGKTSASTAGASSPQELLEDASEALGVNDQ